MIHFRTLIEIIVRLFKTSRYLSPIVVWMFVLNIIVKSSFTQTIDWCAKEFDCINATGGVNKNVLCGPDPEKENVSIILTDEDRKILLKEHNEYRNNFSGGVYRWPPPKNMRQFTWDKTLEKMATRAAFACNLAGNPLECRKTPEYPVIGQNYDTVSNPRKGEPLPIEELTKDWEQKKKLAEDSQEFSLYELVHQYEEGDWAPMVRFIWAETVKMGCGQVLCRIYHTRIKDWVMRYVVVCNYAPGEAVRQPIYQRGGACTGCPTGTKCNPDSIYPRLCALPTDPANGSLYPVPPPPTTTTPPPTTCPPCHCPSRTHSFIKQPWCQHLLLYFPWVSILVIKNIVNDY